MEADVIQALDRLTSAVEKLAEPVSPEIEMGPPICPVCGVFDPEIVLPPSDGGTGRLSGVVVNARCVSCDMEIICIIESYSMHKDLKSAEDELKERRAAWTRRISA